MEAVTRTRRLWPKRRSTNPVAIHMLYRRLYGDSGYKRSTDNTRLKLCGKASNYGG